MRNTFLLFVSYPVYGIFAQQPEWTRTQHKEGSPPGSAPGLAPRSPGASMCLCHLLQPHQTSSQKTAEGNTCAEHHHGQAPSGTTGPGVTQMWPLSQEAHRLGSSLLMWEPELHSALPASCSGLHLPHHHLAAHHPVSFSPCPRYPTFVITSPLPSCLSLKTVLILLKLTQLSPPLGGTTPLCLFLGAGSGSKLTAQAGSG